MGKFVLQRQTAYADAVAGLPLPDLRRMAEHWCGQLDSRLS